jgi:type I restriction enzyme, R subunit
MITDINSEDRLVQQTFAEYLRDHLGWESVYAYNQETFGPGGTLGRTSEREVVLTRNLRDALRRLNPAARWWRAIIRCLGSTTRWPRWSVRRN